MLATLYPVLRPLLFALDPERAHGLTLESLRMAHRLHLLPTVRESAPIELMGLRFKSRVGLAAGLDKNAEYIDALAALGFGFVEVGTVTPRPQAGRDRPRLFRLTSSTALINRMGFPNQGAHAVAEKLRLRRFRGILGVNIGKNADTPLESAVDDYVACHRMLAPHADYVAVNVSSPNTKDLRRLQQSDHLRPILEALLQENAQLTQRSGRRVPLLAKIAPDLTNEEIIQVAKLLLELGIDGVIATNTTVSRPEYVAKREGSVAQEQGGLSGAPLLELSLQAIRTLKAASQGRLAIIGVGGITAAADATQMREAGADLVQVYTGLIYRGPTLVPELTAATSA
ncbi:MAG: quinone-dependent dihydroorotate dehydrogenase [Povalibacter sp.]